MSHAHHHALSSARRLGGSASDYVAVHSWFDASKQAYADTRHRAVLHHTFGVHLLLEIRGRSLTRASDGVAVDRTSLGAQHLEEDCGFAPTLQDWLGVRPLESWTSSRCPTRAQSAHSASRLGGVASDYDALHRWLDQGTGFWDDPRAHAPLHNAFGIFLAEQRFGATYARASDGGLVATRLAAEGHVIRAHGMIPSVERWMGRIPVQPWMRRAATPHARILHAA